MLIEIDHVSAYYGQILALKDMSLGVQEGDLVTLIGANGAGKSTTLKVISGVVNPKKGKVIFDGEDISTTSPRHIIKKGLVHVPEGRQVFPFMTVLENLEMGAFMLKEEDAIQKQLEFVLVRFPVLKQRINQAAGTLSGGEQQMLAIGRGLMAQPRLFLLDEPSLGLAPMLVQAVFHDIEDLHHSGMTILLVEQNASAALKLANKGYVIETGSIILSGKSEDLLNNVTVKKAYLGM